MHIFSRTRTMNSARVNDALAWAAEAAELSGRISGAEVSLSYATLGRPSGTLMWSTRLDSMAQLDELFSGLIANDEYLAHTERSAGLFEAPAEDLLAEVVAATNVTDPKPFNNVVLTQIGAGHFGEARVWGAEISQYIGNLTGRPSIFARASHGPFGAVGWVVGFEDAADVEAGLEKINSDQGYQERVEAGGSFFIEGTGHASLFKRLN